MSGQIDIKQSLKKAYRKQRPTRAEIELLRLELVKMLDEANHKESEEYHKGLLKDFLKKNAYSDYFINTKDRSDLVIHNDKDSKSSVGVIIEMKRPGNKTEMPTIDNLNKKATQELLLYFLRERIANKNFEIEHLIATDLYEWFIFDASEFEKIAENAKLKKAFTNFEQKRLTSEKTELFYKEIAAPALEQVKDKITFTYFDIRDYKKYLKEHTKVGDSKLIELQKIFSPTHLLKLQPANDSNILNKEFYNELLHIIGMEEYKEKGKKLIRRKTQGNRNENSLIEAAITQITSLDKLSQIKDVERFGDNSNERLFNVGLELVLTWINRILFLKLLESQIVGYHKSKDYVFLNKEKVAGYGDLNTLFFQVLAVETKNRRKVIQEKFPNVPYLNSSLFEPTELEQQTIVIGNLPDDITLLLYKKTVVKNNSEKINTLEYLLRFLDAYDFSSEGKEDIAEENKTLINASVLGLIFEKINGYKDGSFFTPGFVTMYMCKETIRRAVVQKFKEQTHFDSDNFGDLVNFTTGTYKKEELKKYNKIINSLKICDPAVGSGHFLVSALNEIIAIKAKLGILTDDIGKRLQDFEMDVENDELMILDGSGEFFKYDPKNRRTHEIQKTLFHEKQTIIENCLFGVDINQNSVNICRLRLWIELLKNAYYKDDGELETLPNIDINIKCGNSLISRYPLDADLKEVLRESRFSIDAYRIAVNSYRNAENKEQKHAMEKLIEKIKGTFTAGIDKNHPKRKKLARLRGKMIELVDQGRLFQTESKKGKQQKIEKLTKEIEKAEAEVEELKTGVIYRNAFEWRFEFPEVLDEKTGDFTGFDIVIGNPPYIDSEGMVNRGQKEIRELISNTYAMAKGNWDIYISFFERSFNILRSLGLLAFITPDKWISKPFGDELRINTFVNLYSVFQTGRDIFESANVDSIVSLFCKNMPTAQLKVCKTKPNNNTLSENEVPKNLLESPFAFDFVFSNHLQLLVKIEANRGKLSNLLECENACATSDAYKLKPFIEDLPESCMFDPKEQLKIINTGTIGKYTPKWGIRKMTYLKDKYLCPVANKKDFLESFQNSYGKKTVQSKLIVKGLTLLDSCLDLDGTIIPGKSTLVVVSDNMEKLKFASAILNSKLAIFYIKERYPASSYNQGINFTKDMINNLPVFQISEKKQKPFVELVDKILAAKKKDPQANTGELENQIDQMVYKLYDLTAEEIAIVEGTGKSN